MSSKATPATRSRARALTTAQKKGKFLAELEKRANVAAAAKAATVHRSVPYRWREKDAKFAAAWDEAVAVAVDSLESEAWRRAAVGTLEPVFQQGFKVGAIRRYSDTLMVTLLKAHRPEKYKDRGTTEHTGPGGEPLPATSIVNVYLPDNGRDEEA